MIYYACHISGPVKQDDTEKDFSGRKGGQKKGKMSPWKTLGLGHWRAQYQRQDGWPTIGKCYEELYKKLRPERICNLMIMLADVLIECLRN